MAQRPLVEALWRQHHPAITDAMRNAIDQEEKRLTDEEREKVMRQFKEVLGEPEAKSPTTPNRQ